MSRGRGEGVHGMPRGRGEGSMACPGEGVHGMPWGRGRGSMACPRVGGRGFMACPGCLGSATVIYDVFCVAVGFLSATERGPRFVSNATLA